MERERDLRLRMMVPTKNGLNLKEEPPATGKMEDLGNNENEIAIASEELVSCIRPLIEQANARIVQSVNSELVLLYWHIGRRISAPEDPRHALRAHCHLQQAEGAGRMSNVKSPNATVKDVLMRSEHVIYSD